MIKSKKCRDIQRGDVMQGGGKPRPYYTRNKYHVRRSIVGAGLAPALLTLLAFALLLSSCSFPGIVSTSAQLPVVSATPTATPLPPIRFPHQALRGDLPPVYAAHFAISDITRGDFHFDQRRLIEPDAILPDGTSTSGIDVHINDWSVKGVNGLDHLTANMANYDLRIDLRGLKPPTLHNRNGLITYGLGGFSYYYSRTRMSLLGMLVDHNQPLQVSGEAWMDHQWGNFLSLGGGGWDWFSIQLSNNTEMMLYLIRDASGKTISSYVGYIGPQAETFLLPPSSLKMTVLNHWKSPVTGANYPSGWRLEISDPQFHASLVLLPELKDQELVVYQSTGNSYWEGAVSIQGQSAGLVVNGEGYVELTGYARGG